MREETVVVYFKILIPYSLRGAAKNHKDLGITGSLTSKVMFITD